MLRNTSITSPPTAVALRLHRRRRKRLGRALQVYGNSTLGLWKLLHALAEEHDDLTGARRRRRRPPWWADQRGRRRPPSAAGALQPQGAPRPPLAGASLSALVRARRTPRPTPSSCGALVGAARRRQRDGDGERDGEHFARAVQQPLAAAADGVPRAARERARRRAERARAGRSPRHAKTRGLLRHSGRLCFDGLEETAKSFMAQSAQEQDRQNKKNAGEVDALAKGLPEPCPESNPIARDMNQQYVSMANAMSPHTAEETNVLYKFWAQGGCPGVSTWSPIPGQWYKAAGTFGTFYGGLLGGSVADPFGRQYGHNELRESPHCFTLLETYLRFCTAPPRALQLGQTVRRAANATAAADAAAIELDRLEQTWATARRRRRGGARGRRVRGAAAAAAGGDARRGGAVAVRGGRPIGAAGGRPFIDDIIKQIENFIKSLLTIIINLIGAARRALAPVMSPCCWRRCGRSSKCCRGSSPSASSPPSSARPSTRRAGAVSPAPTRTTRTDPTRPSPGRSKTLAPRCATRSSRRTPATAPSRRGAATCRKSTAVVHVIVTVNEIPAPMSLSLLGVLLQPVLQHGGAALR